MSIVASSIGGALALLGVGILLMLISRIGRATLSLEERRALDRKEAREDAATRASMGCLWTIVGIFVLVLIIGLLASR